MVGGANSRLESNLIPARDGQRAQTNLLHTRTQGPYRDWDKTMFECLLWGNGLVVVCHRDRGSGCSRLGYGISPLGEGHHQPHHRDARTYTVLGNRLLEGTTEPCAPGTQEKRAVTPQETVPLPVGVWESLAEAWVGGGLLQGWVH